MGRKDADSRDLKTIENAGEKKSQSWVTVREAFGFPAEEGGQVQVSPQGGDKNRVPSNRHAGGAGFQRPDQAFRYLATMRRAWPAGACRLKRPGPGDGRDSQVPISGRVFRAPRLHISRPGPSDVIAMALLVFCLRLYCYVNILQYFHSTTIA